MTSSKPSTAPIVIDANLAVWAVLPHESGHTMVDLFADWHQEGRNIFSPSLWLAEAASVIRRFVYHQIILPSQGQIAIEDLFALGVETISPSQRLYVSAYQWAERLQQAKIYDSLYLALAEELQAEFWTADKRLVNGAAQAGFNQIYWAGEGVTN